MTTPSLIKEKIQEDMKSAMRSQEKDRLATIRLILAALKQREVDERIVLADEHVIAILDKMLKQRRESITQYEAGNRPDLVQKESDEIRIIQEYLPAQLSASEIESLIEAAIKETGASSARDMGKVMGILKPKVQGRADIASVSNKVKERLSA
ncbi:MAG: hypothetical protein ACD_44C00190G0003 [uncultured bacterium]|nr:MAG: hypothetical protein ACD_44C00190G0003 [uncultured bacterium]